MNKTPEIDISKDVIEINETTLKHYEDRNEAELVGTLIKKTKLDQFWSLTVLTTAGRNRDLGSFISVKVAKDYPGIEELREKTRISVKGRLRNRPVYRNGKDSKPEYIAYIDATEVKEAISAMEEAFGIKGRSFGNSYNQVILTGTVSRMVQTNRNSARVTLTINENKKNRLIETVFYARNNMKSILPILAIGNRVCAIAEVQNYKKELGKSYTVNGKTIVKQTTIQDDTPENPALVRNIVILDVSEI